MPLGSFNVIRCMAHFPDADRALQLLERLAAEFRPIMLAHGLIGNILQENISNEAWGWNINQGEEINICLRETDNWTVFRQHDCIVRTFCHELAHNVYSDHSEGHERLLKFFQTWYHERYPRQEAYAGQGHGGGAYEVGQHPQVYRQQEPPVQVARPIQGGYAGYHWGPPVAQGPESHAVPSFATIAYGDGNVFTGAYNTAGDAHAGSEDGGRYVFAGPNPGGRYIHAGEGYSNGYLSYAANPGGEYPAPGQNKTNPEANGGFYYNGFYYRW